MSSGLRRSPGRMHGASTPPILAAPAARRAVVRRRAIASLQIASESPESDRPLVPLPSRDYVQAARVCLVCSWTTSFRPLLAPSSSLFGSRYTRSAADSKFRRRRRSSVQSLHILSSTRSQTDTKSTQTDTRSQTVVKQTSRSERTHIRLRRLTALTLSLSPLRTPREVVLLRHPHYLLRTALRLLPRLPLVLPLMTTWGNTRRGIKPKFSDFTREILRTSNLSSPEG